MILSFNSNSTFALIEGKLHAFGSNQNGKLGINRNEPRISTPTGVDLPFDHSDIITIKSTKETTIILVKGGKIYFSGRNCHPDSQVAETNVFTLLNCFNNVQTIESGGNYFSVISGNVLHIFGKLPRVFYKSPNESFDKSLKFEINCTKINKISCCSKKLLVLTDTGLWILGDCLRDIPLDSDGNYDFVPINCYQQLYLYMRPNESRQIVYFACDDDKIMFLRNKKVYIKSHIIPNGDWVMLDDYTFKNMKIIPGTDVEVLCEMEVEGQMRSVTVHIEKQLITPSGSDQRRLPVCMSLFPKKVTNVYKNGDNGMYLSDGKLYCYGTNEYGELGLGHFDEIKLDDCVAMTFFY